METTVLGYSTQMNIYSISGVQGARETLASCHDQPGGSRGTESLWGGHI